MHLLHANLKSSSSTSNRYEKTDNNNNGNDNDDDAKKNLSVIVMLTLLMLTFRSVKLLRVIQAKTVALPCSLYSVMEWREREGERVVRELRRDKDRSAYLRLTMINHYDITVLVSSEVFPITFVCFVSITCSTLPDHFKIDEI